MTGFIYDGERVIQVAQIESVEATERESMTDPAQYGDRPEIQTVEARVIHTISGRSYYSDGSVHEIIDLLMS